jgi:hypothetical protein
MVLGALWCPEDQAQIVFKEIRAIKVRNELSPKLEIKWTKVSPAKISFYYQLIDYIYDNDDLHFIALVIPDKTILRHDEHSQTHDEWYYKMYFEMIKIIISPSDCYRIYLDIKDTRGGAKARKLHEVLCNSMHDFSREIIERVQIVKSHEVEILQLADLLIGAVSAVNRNCSESDAKKAIIARIQQRSGYSLQETTSPRELKTNLLVWHPREEI